MLLFGHLGITLAVTQTFAVLWQGKKRFSESIDYRLVLLGSMLPDIIDKPLGGFIFKDTLGSGRTYAHTLIFLLLLGGTGLFFWVKEKRAGILVLAGGSFVHHILDGMWCLPETYLWPFYGWSFPKGNPEGWFWQWMESLLTDPGVCLPEIIGIVFTLYFFFTLHARKQVGEFVKSGRIEPKRP